MGLTDRSAAEDAALDAGAAYLLARRLFRSVSKGGAVMDPAWLRLAFPRFYEYDVLRGLAFVAAWSRLRGKSLPETAVAEAAAAVRVHETPAGVAPQRRAWEGAGTLMAGPAWTWAPGAAAAFPLLTAVGVPGVADPSLTRQWRACRL